MAKLPSSTGGLPPKHYRVTVTSTAMPTYVELNLAYDCVSEAWNENKYTLELHESLRELTPSTGEVTTFLKRFGRNTTSERAIEWGKSHGHRLAFPWEREAFSKANPNLQRKFCIVDLGSFIVDDDGWCVPVLYERDGGRNLGYDWFDDGWFADHCFLFVRE